MIRIDSLLRLVLLVGVCGLNSCGRRVAVERARAEAQLREAQDMAREELRMAQDMAEPARSQAALKSLPTDPPDDLGAGQLSGQDARELVVPGFEKTGNKGMFELRDVEVMESMPVQFAVKLASFLPTELLLDELVPVSKTGLIIARVRFKKPAEGAPPKSVPARLALGALKVGEYRLEVHLAPSQDAPHVRLQTFGMTAR